MKRAFIIHGWEGTPNDGWYPWLKRELEANEFEVQVPAMPDPEEPKIDQWVSHLRGVVGDVDADTYFICHSIGCQTLLRYLETLPDDKKVGTIVLVAPFTNLVNLENAESERIARPWLNKPLDWRRIRTHTGDIFCLFSSDDPWVPVSESEIFSNNLSAMTMVLPNQGHFTGDELPLNIDKILSLLD